LTISSLGSTTTTALTILAQAATNAVGLSQNVELDQIDGRMQDQLNQKIAALQTPPDAATISQTESQLKQLQQQGSTVSKQTSQYTANSNVLSEIQNQLTALQTAAAQGDATSFDNGLAVANTELSNLMAIPPTAPYQPDHVLGLQGSGFGIQSSSTYDLSTPAGQNAAQADIQTALNLVSQASAATTSNELVATSLSTALSGQIGSLDTTLQQDEQTDQMQLAAQTAQLTQQTQDQEHLIELALGNTTQLSTVLSQIENPPQTATSAFDVLSSAVGATASSYTSQGSSPPILSLFA